MSLAALKTIKAHNWKTSRYACQKLATDFINMISKRYPNGFAEVEDNDERLRLERDTYFVMLGYEHVTKNQPVAVFDLTEGVWKLDVKTNHFK